MMCARVAHRSKKSISTGILVLVLRCKRFEEGFILGWVLVLVIVIDLPQMI